MARKIKDIILIVSGILAAGMGLKGFLLSSHFIDGGVTGLSMLLSSAFGLPLALLIPIINLPFIWLGYRQISHAFAYKAAAAIVGLSLVLAFVPFPDVTPDKLLTAVFGGACIGTGIGLAMRGGAVLDGTEIAAVLISRASPILRVGDAILVLNVGIFGAAAFLFGIESAMYSLLTYFSAAKAIDFLVNGLEEYTAIIIISDEHAAIRRMITLKLQKGVTVLKAEKGLGSRGGSTDATNVLYSVVTRLEVSALREQIRQIDPAAFVIQHALSDAQGGLVRRRALH